MPRLRSFLVTCLLLTATCAALAAAVGKPRLDGAALTADLQVLKAAFSAMHPGLLRYNTAAEIDRAFALAQQHLEHGASLGQVFLELAALTAKIQCGHTYPNFFNQNDEVVKTLFGGRTRTPFFFRWIEGQMVVTRDLTEGGELPRGTKIERLNGVYARDLLAQLKPYVRADGANEGKRIALLGVTGASRWEAFDIYYPLLRPQASPRYDLEVQTPSGRHRRISVAAMTAEEREGAAKKGMAAESQDAPFSKSFDPGHTETIRMPSWALFNSKWDWRNWLDQAMDEAAEQKAPELILDIRDNEGGEDEIGRWIISRLIEKPLPLTSYKRLVRYREAPHDLEPFLDTWDRTFLSLGRDATLFQQRLPDLPGATWYELGGPNTDAGTPRVEPRRSRFSGRVVVLIDASNSSATFQFAAAIRENHLGLLIGETTGGNQRGINGGAFFFLRLPNSGIEVDLPLIGSFPADSKPNAGLSPDIFVRTTAQDIARGADPQMAAAMKQ